MVISWICLNLNIVYVIITKMVKIRDSTKPWSPFIHIDRRNSFTLDLRKQGIYISFPLCLNTKWSKNQEKMNAHPQVRLPHPRIFSRPPAQFVKYQTCIRHLFLNQ